MYLSKRMQDMLKALKPLSSKGRKAHQTPIGLWVIPGCDLTGYNSITVFRLMFNGLVDWSDKHFRHIHLTNEGKALADTLNSLKPLE